MRSRKLWSVILGVLLLVFAAAPLVHAQNPPPSKPKDLEGFHLVLLAGQPYEVKAI